MAGACARRRGFVKRPGVRLGDERQWESRIHVPWRMTKHAARRRNPWQMCITSIAQERCILHVEPPNQPPRRRYIARNRFFFHHFLSAYNILLTMGWLPWSSSDESGVKKTSGGAFERPTRTNRAKCYEARDAFFECLDRNNILDSINTKSGKAAAAKACGQADQEFEKNCAHSWVSVATFTQPAEAATSSLHSCPSG